MFGEEKKKKKKKKKEIPFVCVFSHFIIASERETAAPARPPAPWSSFQRTL